MSKVDVALQEMLETINEHVKELKSRVGRQPYDATGRLVAIVETETDEQGRPETRYVFDDGTFVGANPGAKGYIAQQLQELDLTKPIRIHREQAERRWYATQAA